MRRSLYAALGLWCACSKGGSLGGLVLEVQLKPGAKASCVDAKLSRGDDTMLMSTAVEVAGKTQLEIGVGSEGYPRDVVLSVQPLWSPSGCSGAAPNGLAQKRSAQFPPSGVDKVVFEISPPPADQDGDRDGFVASPGPDCNDQNAAAFPGATEDCATLADLDCDGQSGCGDAQCSAVPGCAQPATELVFVTGPRTVDVGACSGALTVESRNTQGAAALPRNTALNLAANPATPVTFYSDAACTVAVSTVSSPVPASGFSFFFKASTHGSYEVTVSSGGLSPARQVQTVRAPNGKLAFVNAMRGVQVGGCSAALEVELQQHDGTPQVAGTTLPVTVGVLPPGAVTLHSTPACDGPASNQFSVAPGSSRTSLYAKGVVAGAARLTAISAGYSDAVQMVSVSAGLPGVPFALQFTTPALTQPVGSCSSSPLTVVTLDDAGSLAPVGTGATLTLLLSSDAGLAFFHGSGCDAGTAVTTLGVVGPGSSADFWVSGTRAGTSSVSVDAVSLAGARQPIMLTPGPPSVLAFASPPRSTAVSACVASPLIFETRDSFGNAARVSTQQDVVVDGGSNLTVHADSSCGTVVTSIPLPANEYTRSFYVKSAVVGSHRVTLGLPNFTAASQAVDITSQGATQLAFVTNPQTNYAGACSQMVTVERRDSAGVAALDPLAATVMLTGLPTGFTFYSDATCTAVVTSVSIASNASQANFWFRGVTAAPGSTIQVAANGLSSATQPVTIHPAVRRGVCTIPSGAALMSCPLSPPLPALERSFLLFQAAPPASNTDGPTSLARCTLVTATSLLCQRFGNPSLALPVHYQVATIPTQVSVVHLTDRPCNNNGRPMTVTLASSSLTNTFVLHSLEANSGDADHEENYSVQLSATQISLSHEDNRCANDLHDLEVVTLTGATVERGTQTMANAVNSSTFVSTNTVPVDRTLVLYSWRSASGGNDACERSVRASIPGNSSVLFSRANGSASTACSNDGTLTLAFERVQLPAGYSVQQVDFYLADGEASNSKAIVPVDPTRTLLLTGSQVHSGSGQGETTLTSSSSVSHIVHQFGFDGGAELTATRTGTLGDTRLTVFVVQLDPR